MQTLETLAASVADQLEPRRVAAPLADRAAESELDGRAAAALMRWVATHGLDGSVFVAGWEIGVQGQRGTDGFGGLLDRASAVEHAVWEAVASEAKSLAGEELTALVVRLRVAVRMLTRSAVKGFITGRDQSHRHWLRDLRHDLRNPIGAIKNAVALLEETQDETGTVQRLCTIASRNASALESLVRSRAADDADPGALDWAGQAPASAVIDRTVAELGALAPSVAGRMLVRRPPTQPVDALALEIALHALLRHTLATGHPVQLAGTRSRSSRKGESVVLRVGLGATPGDVAEPNHQVAAADDGPLVALARNALEGSDGLLEPQPAENGFALALPVLGSRKESHDLAGDDKRPNRQPRTH